MGFTIGVDVGGTKIAAGLVDEAGNLLTKIRRATPVNGGDAAIPIVSAMANELVGWAKNNGNADIDGIGIGAPGICTADRTTVTRAANLHWFDVPIATIVTEETGIRTVAENDANAAAWAEYRFGAGRGSGSMIAVTLGTGIGGGIVFDGNLLRGSQGYAAEIGHIAVMPSGRRCGCGKRGCWERYASGTALVHEAHELLRWTPERAPMLFELCGGHVEQITGPMVMDAAAAGDEGAQDVVHFVAHWIGVGLGDLTNILDPDVFVIGGGLGEAGDILLDPARAAFEENVMNANARRLARIVPAQMGGDAGIVGAADLARF
ncbi:MAG: ROK family glucokinase [Actinomycetaceae bacterium]|nr:ROK family glucokinase [Actinomycetaceae bacterium]MDY6082604.1 ROK family glucokinase [Actinomycetaceae bacterium]